MIDVTNKVLYFGEGNILVENTTFGFRFRAFEPPVEVGYQFKEEPEVEVPGLEYKSEWVVVPIVYYEEAKRFGELLDKMDGEGSYYFHFGDYQFNFSKWNPKSIEVLKRHLKVIKSNILMCIAC